jgi:hypothetical protein
MTIDELKILVQDMTGQGVTRRFIAEESGYSGSALSSWMKGTYGKGGEDRTFEMALRSALERILQKRFFSGNRDARKFPRMNTSVAESVFLAAKSCQHQGLMGLITGSGGRGKSTAAEMYTASHSGVVYVQTSPVMTKKHLMAAIAEPLDVSGKSSYDLLVGICEKMRQSKCLVIIDEAEHLSLDILDAVRQINDWSGAGLLFIGQEPFYAMLAKARKSHEYLVDRFKLRMRVSDLGLSDVRMLVSTEITELDGHAAAFLKACGGSARFLETLTYKLLPLVSSGEALSERMILETAEAVKIF